MKIPPEQLAAIRERAKAREALEAAIRWVEGGAPKDDAQVAFRQKILRDGITAYDEQAKEIERLREVVWSPENENFAKGVIREAGHQVERWGSEHDEGKEPQDWFWLIGYLAGKALRAAIDGNDEKAKHHCISTAAVCANWHRRISGTELSFRPGLGPDRQETKPPKEQQNEQ